MFCCTSRMPVLFLKHIFILIGILTLLACCAKVFLNTHPSLLPQVKPQPPP